jgi:hypothetical protein
LNELKMLVDFDFQAIHFCLGSEFRNSLGFVFGIFCGFVGLKAENARRLCWRVCGELRDSNCLRVASNKD